MDSENWKYLSIGDCASVVGGGTPSTKNPEYWDGDISWISPKDLSNNTNKYVSRGERFITKKGLENSSAKILPENSLLFSSRAPIGYLAINTQPMATNQGFKSLILKDEFDVEFFYYLFKQKTEYIKNFSSGSTFQEISGSEIKNLKFLIPPYKEQKQISKILSKLDKKIELNQKMNETLQDIAKTLFKSWFIDFDPVVAKAEGRPTELSKDISDLFPDSFENSDLGKIPKGWKSGNLGDLFEPSRGKVITKSKINPGIVPVVAGGIKPPYYHSESNVKGPVITISASGTAGYVNLYYQDIWASDCSYVDKDTFKKIFFAHSFLKINQVRIYDLRHGAVQQHVYPKDLAELPIVISPDSIINAYEDIASQLHKKIETNLNESETLVDLRDTLLPKLISGELKIPDAESLIEEASV
jgi:type I restriction enzyme S subunit